ncbi:hypothetical protein D8Y22_08360 [Salinadaptatus halalkaliphilus]|uniref:DUF1102 domain-containing protein n=1 Tax=Salinadaptatus halalkaliphilus TaxID=2419781 RepID=A0A4S3TM86_9EURY|nr:hypothetical protein [Salinadaptatus halalkaliphilus]THE65216.1 hypothetical protein D8Y22_08360 [Salinadaptatus halalkaliphilus]
MNRRNVLVGLGTIVAGGGAALGSGAFSTAEATRDLDVNVVTDDEIAEEFVDILLTDVDGTDSVGVDNGGDSDATNMFPEQEVNYDNHTATEADVSLMQNDVTIIFGPDGNALPPNSTVSYDELITVVNDEGDSPQDFEVSFSVGGDEPSSVILDPNEPEVDSGESESVDVTVETGDEDSSGTLTIEITAS